MAGPLTPEQYPVTRRHGTGVHRAVEPAAVREHQDRFWLMRRTELGCASCDARLGRVFRTVPSRPECPTA